MSEVKSKAHATAQDYLQTAIKDAVQWHRENYKTGFLNPKLNEKTEPLQLFMNITAKAEMLKQTAHQFARVQSLDAALIESTQNVIQDYLTDLSREFWPSQNNVN
jgi:hypothetical protein